MPVSAFPACRAARQQLRTGRPTSEKIMQTCNFRMMSMDVVEPYDERQTVDGGINYRTRMGPRSMGNTELNYALREISDYYEFLQISPSASSETIHRIYRFWASRYHPDNAETGNDEMFYLLRTAYEVLSDPERRASYDALRGQPASISLAPLSSIVDFMDELEGERNRRLAVLAILYCRRRSSPRDSEVSLRDLEIILAFPRDYLDFTTWYLVQKGFMKRAYNSDFTITVSGVDYVETQRVNLPVLNRLLSAGRLRLAEAIVERRVSARDRRIGLPDTRLVKIERRLNRRDRRVNKDDTRAENFCVKEGSEKFGESAGLEPESQS